MLERFNYKMHIFTIRMLNQFVVYEYIQGNICEEAF